MLEPSEMFKVLAIETRVKIIELLKTNGPMGSKCIASRLGITAAAASQHLKILKQAGLVRSERKGYWIPYILNEEALENCQSLLTDVCTCGCGGKGKLNEKTLEDSSLEALKKYEKELHDEIKTVRDRIKELEKNK